MKKALSVALALLVALSMFSVMAFAEAAEAPITVIFKVDGVVVKEVNVASGTVLTPYVPDDPVRQDTDTERYTFKGWKAEEGDDNLYYRNTFPKATLAEGETSKTIIYNAEFAVEDISGRQSLWNFIESLFERLNLLFEYFATIFNW